MQDNKYKSFDFDRWVDWAENNPEQFEVKRRELVDNLINEAPAHLKQRMEGLQWRIDQIRKQSSTPMGSCLKLYSMMWDTVLGEGGLVDTLERPVDAILAENDPNRATIDNIISLKQPKDDTD